MTSQNPMERQLRIAGVVVLLGLLVEVVAFRWAHPAAFLDLAFIGISLASLGIVIYLYSLVSLRRRPTFAWSRLWVVECGREPGQVPAGG